MTVSSSTNKVSYSGNGTLTTFAYSFKIFDQDDLTVILRAADGTETTQTITTHYTVTGVGSASGGNVVFGSAPASGVTVVIIREQPLTQGLDLVPNDPFPAQSLEESLDKLTFMAQKHEEELGRAIKASRTNVITGSEFTISATDRANKVFAFDGSGDLSVTQELGTFKGNWSASTSYVPRDIVKDTSTNNIFIANTAHTSSGSQPLTTNTDSAKWDLLVDAASATTSATNAATSETNAATSATNAATSATNAATSETNAATSATNAATSATSAASSATSAAASYDSFDDRYLGAKSSDPTVDNDGDALVTGALYFNTTSGMKVYDGSSWDDVKPTSSEQTNIDTVAGISSNVTTVAGISSNVTTVAGISSDVTTVAADGTDIGTVAGISANVTTVAGIDSDVTTVAGISSNVTAVAGDATDIGTVATDIANVNTVAGNNTNINTVAGISSNVTTVAGISANVTTVAGDTANIGTIATNLGGTDTIGTVAGSISNVNTVGGAIANVNTVATNISGVNSFAERYRVGSADPTTSLDAGDLAFNTTDSGFKFYDGSSWQTVNVSGIGNIVEDTTPQLGGDLDVNGNNIELGTSTGLDNNRITFGPSGNELKIYSDAAFKYIEAGSSSSSDLYITAGDDIFIGSGTAASFTNMARFLNGTGGVLLYCDNSLKLRTNSTGVDVTGTADMDTLSIGGTAITSTAAELNLLDGVTATTTELNYVDVTTLGTSQASKAVTADANGDVNLAEELKAKSYNETYAAVTSSSNATTVNCENGNAFSHTLTENTTFTFSGEPASGTAFSFSIEIIQDASASGYTVTWPTEVDWPAATAPTLTATASAKDVFVFYTRDGGTNWYGFTAGQALG